MSNYKNGSIIGAENTPTTSVASGVWDLNSVRDYVDEGIWPLGSCSCTPAYSTGDRTATITASWNGGATIQLGTASNLVDGAFDNDSSDAMIFNTDGDVTGDYFEFDFGSGASVKITELKIYLGGGTGSQAYGSAWQAAGSDNGSDFTDIGSTFSITGAASGGQNINTITTLSGNTDGYRYYRFTAGSGSFPGSNRDWFQEFEFEECDC